MLAKLADLKEQLKITDTTDDGRLTFLLDKISARFAGDCHRIMERVVDYTEVLDGGDPHVLVHAYPIESVKSIKEAVEEDFANADALAAKSDYTLDRQGKSGLIYRVGGRWLDDRNAVQVIYTGGYVDPATTEPPTPSALYVPAEVQGCIIEQCMFRWQRRGEIGLVSVGQGGATWQVTGKEPWVQMDVVNRYKRHG